MQEIEKKEADLLIPGLLESLKHASEKTYYGKKRKREAYTYRYEGVPVCVRAFRYVYDVGKKRLGILMSHLNKHGLIPREHSYTRRTPHNALRFPDVQKCVKFILRLAEVFGIPQPAPLHGTDGKPPVYLPASHNCKDVHALYTTACIDANVRAVSYSSFRSTWSQ